MTFTHDTKAHGKLHVLHPTDELQALLTIIRNRETSRSDFIFYSDRVIRLLVEEGSGAVLVMG